jgi:hypothetical protein
MAATRSVNSWDMSVHRIGEGAKKVLLFDKKATGGRGPTSSIGLIFLLQNDC